MKEPIHAHRERGNERIYKGTNTHRQKNTVDYVWKLKGEGSGVLLLALSLSPITFNITFEMCQHELPETQ